MDRKFLYLEATLCILAIAIPYVIFRLSQYLGLLLYSDISGIFYAVILPWGALVSLALICVLRSKFVNITSIIRAAIGAVVAVMLPYIYGWYDKNWGHSIGVDFFLAFLFISMPVYLAFFMMIGWNWNKIWEKLKEKPYDRYKK
jgi:uncharacterized membrane protein YeaQ/YmgE (transglycosylase-associated protein family)